MGWWNRRNSPGSTHPPHRTLLPGDNLDTTHFAAGSLDETTYRCTLRYPKATEQPLALGVTVTTWEPARSPKWLHQGCPQRCDPATAVCGGVGTFHLPPAPCAVPCSPWGHRHPSSKGRRRLNPKGCWGSPHKAQCWGGISSALLRVTWGRGGGAVDAQGQVFLSRTGLSSPNPSTATPARRGGGGTHSPGVKALAWLPVATLGGDPRGGRGQPPPGAAGPPPHGLPRAPCRQRPGHGVNLRLLRAARFLPAPPSPAATRHFPPPFYTLDHQRDFLGRGSQSDSGNASPSHWGTSHGRTRRVRVCVCVFPVTRALAPTGDP